MIQRGGWGALGVRGDLRSSSLEEKKKEEVEQLKISTIFIFSSSFLYVLLYLTISLSLSLYLSLRCSNFVIYGFDV